ncbi:MAG: ABC transporter substrate-binding protein [Cyclobacteriaceae bacterium]|nr:ABC transporter substrate-binding protein [Cyclobacteriaceae bacterium]
MPVKTTTDQLGLALEIPFPPTRIISLVPSQTELLYDLKLNAEVVGITKFCVHPPEWRKTKTIIGGTKKFNFEVIDRLKPDLIIGNKEENYREGIEILRQKYPVWMSDIVTPTDAINMMHSLGEITGKSTEAERLIADIQKSLDGVKGWLREPQPPTREPNPSKSVSLHEALEGNGASGNGKRVLYLIWRNPWMGAAANTFIHEMLTLAGFENCLKEQERYPELSVADLVALNPDLVFLSSEPYPFSEKHIEEMQSLLPIAKILLVDGEMFSWYGSRMRYFASYLATLPLA